MTFGSRQGGAVSTMGRKLGGKNLEVKLGSGDALDVRQFSVQERMSTLFEVNLVAVSDNPSIDFDAVVGQPATFSISAGTHDKFWVGVCNHFEQVRAEPSGLSTYQFSIVPRLWLLTQRKNHRMFQQISEPDIALKLLKEWDIDPTIRIDKGAYKKRKYRVQYGESDFTFMCRMLEDAGITFYFEQDGEETKLVLADAPQSNAKRGGALSFVDDTSMVRNVALEFVTGVRMGQRVRPGKYTIRDHDYRKAPTYKLMSTVSKGLAVEEKLERFQYAPGAFLFGADSGDATPSADDKGKVRTDEKEGAVLAQKRLDAKRGSARVVAFETNAHDLAPGVVMNMSGHPNAALGDGKALLVVQSSLSGTDRGEWAHHCEARGTEIPFRPELSTPKPKVNGVESATVVGPAGEEIHTDEFGRVRVHFHWDRESKMDDNSSCWIHVSQSWGGAGYGGTNLPRIGQEVLVDFLGGDPDRPVIVGRVYTNLQKTPYKLPDNKTQSGWKSNSTGGGGGFNEVMFEDAVGKELLNIQAEKDLKKLVKNDENVTIGRNRTKLVKSNDSLTVGANRTKRVVHNENASIGMNKTLSVGINRSTQVGTADTTTAGELFAVSIVPPGEGGWEDFTRWLLYPNKIVAETQGGAKLVLDGKTITLDAENVIVKGSKGITIESSGGDVSITGKNVKISASAGSVDITGGPVVNINGPGLFAGRVTDPAPAAILRGSSTVFIGGPTFPFDVVRLPDGTLQVGKNIKIAGDETYQRKVLANLSEISRTPTGMGLLNSIDAGSKSVTIAPISPGNSGNSTSYANNADRFYKPDGTPGPGSNSTIEFDPDRQTISSDPWGTRPPAIGLGHEMGHADQASRGITTAGQSNNDSLPDPTDPSKFTQTNTRELEVTGVPPHTTYPYNENKIRSEWNPPQPQRPWY